MFRVYEETFYYRRRGRNTEEWLSVYYLETSYVTFLSSSWGIHLLSLPSTNIPYDIEFTIKNTPR